MNAIHAGVQLAWRSSMSIGGDPWPCQAQCSVASTASIHPGPPQQPVVFDLMAAGQHDLRMLPYHAHPAQLEHVLADVSTQSLVQLIPMTTNRAAALTWFDPSFTDQGIEGLVAKPLRAPYRGRRGPWLKIRRKLVLDADAIGVTGPRSSLRRWSSPSPTTTPHRGRSACQQPSRVPSASRWPAGCIRLANRRNSPGVVGGLPGQPATCYTPVARGVVVEIEADACVEFGAGSGTGHVCSAKAFNLIPVRPRQRRSVADVSEGGAGSLASLCVVGGVG